MQKVESSSLFIRSNESPASRGFLLLSDGDVILCGNGQCVIMRPDFKPGDTIPQGPGRTLRVVNVIDPDDEGQLPLLVVELASHDRTEPTS